MFTAIDQNAKIFILLLFIGGIFVMFHFQQKRNTEIIAQQQEVIDSLNTEINVFKDGIDSVFSYYNEHDTLFNPKKLKYAMKVLNIKAINTVLAQFKLETGYFTSYSFQKRKNLGGYMSNKTGQLRYFDHWLDCVIFTKAFQTRKYKPSIHDDYYDFLVKIGYAEGDSLTGIHGYINSVKKIEKQE